MRNSQEKKHSWGLYIFTKIVRHNRTVPLTLRRRVNFWILYNPHIFYLPTMFYVSYHKEQLLSSRMNQWNKFFKIITNDLNNSLKTQKNFSSTKFKYVLLYRNDFIFHQQSFKFYVLLWKLRENKSRLHYDFYNIFHSLLCRNPTLYCLLIGWYQICTNITSINWPGLSSHIESRLSCFSPCPPMRTAELELM